MPDTGIEIYEYIYAVLTDEENKYCEKQHQLIDIINAQLSVAAQEDNYYYYDETEAKKVIAFLETLTLWQEESAGQKLKLTIWQRFLIFCMYGFKLREDNTPLHTDVLLEIGKKNGKTLLGSGLLLYNLLTKRGAEIYTVACDYQQSKKAFDNVVQFIMLNPKLAALFNKGDIEIRENDLVILYRPTLSKIVCKSETRTKSLQGYKPSFILFDEIASYRSNEIIQKLKSGRTDKSGAIALSITTAETNQNNPGYYEYEKAEQVLKGYKNDSYLPVIFELDKEDLWTDEKNYFKANPNIGITGITLAGMIKLRNDAILDPTATDSFRSYKLNQWLQNAVNGLNGQDWQVCKDNAKKYAKYITEDKLKTYPAYAALDLSKSDDYTAYSICFYIPDIDKYYYKHKCYIPKAMIDKKQHSDNQQITIWIRNGYVKPTIGGNENNRIVNVRDIIEQIAKDFQTYQIMGLAIDPAFSKDFKSIMNYEHENIPVIDFLQKYPMLTSANKRFKDSVEQGMIISDNPVMDWMVSCAAISIGANGNIYFEKPDYRQSPKRIDLIDTSAMSIGMLFDNKESLLGANSYEDLLDRIMAADKPEEKAKDFDPWENAHDMFRQMNGI